LTSNNLSGGVLSRGCSADVRRCDEELAKTGIAKKLKQPAWFTQEGSIVQLEELSFGLKSQYKLRHPDKFIFVDEVGSNTSQTKDSHYGGEKHLVLGAAARPQQRKMPISLSWDLRLPPGNP